MQLRLLDKRHGDRNTLLSSRWEGLFFHRRMSAIHPGSLNHRLRHHATDTSMYQASPFATSLRYHRSRAEPTHAVVLTSSRFAPVKPSCFELGRIDFLLSDMRRAPRPSFCADLLLHCPIRCTLARFTGNL